MVSVATDNHRVYQESVARCVQDMEIILTQVHFTLDTLLRTYNILSDGNNVAKVRYQNENEID